MSALGCEAAAASAAGTGTGPSSSVAPPLLVSWLESVSRVFQQPRSSIRSVTTIMMYEQADAEVERVDAIEVPACGQCGAGERVDWVRQTYAAADRELKACTTKLRSRAEADVPARIFLSWPAMGRQAAATTNDT